MLTFRTTIAAALTFVFTASVQAESVLAPVTPSTQMGYSGPVQAVIPAQIAAPPIARVSAVKELIRQADFAYGFNAVKGCQDVDVNKACSEGPTYPIANPLHKDNPVSGSVWKMAQWGSKSSLPANATYDPADGGAYKFANGEKGVRLFKDGRVEFAMNNVAELGGKYKEYTLADKWPHLLLEQTISAPGGTVPSGTLPTIGHLNFQIDVRLMYNDPHKQPGYDSAKHASQFQIFFTVQNLNTASEGYGQYAWLGVPIYDDRTPMLPLEKGFKDSGTNMMIYGIPSSALAAQSVHSGNWIHMQADILPFAKDAIVQGSTRGMLKSARLEDYQIGGMNIGFEVTGLNITTLQFKNLSLKTGEAAAVGDVGGQKLAEGYYRLGTTDAIFYSNGTDKYCTFNSAETFFKWRGRTGFADVPSRASVPTGMTNDGGCKDPSGAAGSASRGLASASTNDRVAQGFYRIGGGDGIFYSNGADAYCVFTKPETLFKWRGKPGYDGIGNQPRLPIGMRSDGACP